METLKLLNNTIDYIERNLDATLDIDEIAKVAYSSRYHFQRVFYALTGFTVTEYIRNRRLTLAGEELAATDKKVIDVSLKYGYESPEAFTKAFKRLHGISPSVLRKLNGKIKAFPKISFQISIKGECEMIYRIVEKDAFKVFGAGFVTTTLNDAVYKNIPEFINEIFENGTHDSINELIGNPKGTLLDGFHYGFEEDGTRKYIMGAELPETEISDKFTILQIPKLTWAVFEGKGAIPTNLIIQDIWKRIYSEWFPSSSFEQVEGPCIEKNFWKGEKQDGYRCELWIPVKIKDDCADNVEFEKIYTEKFYRLNLRKETQHFIINYTEMDKTCIEKVSNILENNYNKITTNLKQQLQEKLTLLIHPDLNQLHIALGFPDAPNWIRGGLGAGKIIIASPLNPPPGSNFDNVLNTAIHEFVHIIVNKINSDIPRWLNEGIASYEAKDNNANWIIETVKNGLTSNMLPTFKDLDTGEDFETFFKRDGYQYSYTIVESIIKNFGYDKLYNLIKFPNNFVDILDMTENQFQDNWIEYIKNKYLLN